MNTLTQSGVSHHFATPDELLALSRVRKFTDDPTCSYLAQGDGHLVAFLGKPPVMHVIGQLAQPVVLPKTLTLRKEVKP